MILHSLNHLCDYCNDTINLGEKCFGKQGDFHECLRSHNLMHVSYAIFVVCR